MSTQLFDLSSLSYFSNSSLVYNPFQMSRLPSSSSSSTFIDPPFQLDHHLDVDKRMTGKGFIEPHRDNLPRRKRKVVTTLEHGAIQVGALHTDKKILPPKSEAGPRSSIQESNLQEGTSPTSTDHATFGFTASVDTNITEPPSSIRASPTLSTPLHNKPPTSSNSSTNFFLSHPTIQTPKRSFFHGYHHLDDALLRSSLPITPSKGHLQPTSATLPRRHRLSVTREELRRKCLLEQQGKSLCEQELSKGIILGFLAAGDEREENIVRIIKVFNDSIPPSRTSTALSTLSSEPYLQLTLPSDSTSYIDGTTSLTDSQIQQACTFIDEHISPPPADTSSINSNSGSTLRRRSGNDVSVLILGPCIRPEEAMSIGISYLAGKEDMMKGVEEGKGDEAG